MQHSFNGFDASHVASHLCPIQMQYWTSCKAEVSCSMMGCSKAREAVPDVKPTE